MPWLVHRDAVPVSLHVGEKSAAVSSLVQCRGAPVMSGERYDLFTDLLGEGCEDGFSVGLVETERLRGSPATAVLACGWDLLRDEAFAFAERLEEVGWVFFPFFSFLFFFFLFSFFFKTSQNCSCSLVWSLGVPPFSFLHSQSLPYLVSYPLNISSLD